MPRIPLSSLESNSTPEQKTVLDEQAMTLLAHGMPLPEGVEPPLAKRK